MKVSEKTLLNLAQAMAEITFEEFQEEAAKDGRVAFLDDVVEVEEFNELLGKLQLDSKVGAEINNAATAWAYEAGREAYVRGFKTALKIVQEMTRSSEADYQAKDSEVA
ncbi:hypothetical protein NLX67_20555 [Domibacillus sp. A3M-37]|uniref:hypothetical protein n=1 Tax=Domibacillus sp. A3M-37 TaxID=2962037 RepID=UPI0020B6A53F|nr:hypothetical protein [Domibacillus sp. A3M-37]MCP3764729.1 hypothetical protein [Domibacillus sp. A3M-37]